jgi:hypothetical protein
MEERRGIMGVNKNAKATSARDLKQAYNSV